MIPQGFRQASVASVKLEEISAPENENRFIFVRSVTSKVTK